MIVQILSFQYTCQMLLILQTPNMPIDNEYGSYTLGYATLEFYGQFSYISMVDF